MMQSMIKVTEMCIKMLVFIYFTTYPHSWLTPVSPYNKSNHHDIAEILLKVYKH
jgi:hypothetical protein